MVAGHGLAMQRYGAFVAPEKDIMMHTDHNAHDDAELMDPETWDSDHIQIHEPVANAEAIVPVRLTRAELVRVEQLARQHGLAITDVLRLAVAEWIAGQTTSAYRWTSGHNAAGIGATSQSTVAVDAHIRTESIAGQSTS